MMAELVGPGCQVSRTEQKSKGGTGTQKMHQTIGGTAEVAAWAVGVCAGEGGSFGLITVYSTQSDYQLEIGGKRSLTPGHIHALSKQFGIPAAMFV